MTAQPLELVDADAHVNPPPTFWDDYLPKAFAGRGPQIEEGGLDEEHDWVVFEGAWQGFGFHEDGLVSGLRAAEAFGVTW